METLNHLVSTIRSYTAKIEPLWTIIGAPITQELLFRFIPYQFFFVRTGKFWEIGIASSIIYSLIHWYFGPLVVIGTFIFGLILWWIMVKLGLFPAILLHALINIIILVFWGTKWLAK